ncbi:hypothetical protein [Micromonospora hortensis]|uniref:hypothetical protein n=1 Tax=Micromonospora hortensis TaxID=2911209 RepID=UPI001EE844EA|nr:hypothetical protein [Micromonospora hortensis]MCG5452593.1 hypothetical protein [Micromonospora hortensis]
MDDETGSTTSRPLRALLRWLGAAAAIAGIVGVVFQVIEWAGSRATPEVRSSAGASPTVATPTAKASGDEQFVQAGQCVRNVGGVATVVYEIATCGPGTWRVLARVEQAVVDEAQADAVCEAQAPGFAEYHYSNWTKRSDYLDVVFCVAPV